jgi:hypothetical protein
LKKNRKANLIPLPEGVEVGHRILYYERGWRTGTLQRVEHNQAYIVPTTMYHDGTGHAKAVAITDIKAIEKEV